MLKKIRNKLPERYWKEYGSTLEDMETMQLLSVFALMNTLS